MAENDKHLEELAVLVAAGQTIRSAAAQMPFSESTAYRTSSTPKFRQRVAELRSEVTSATVGRLTEAATQAVETLAELLGNSNEPSIRLQAAKAILASLGPVTESMELRQRLDALEAERKLRVVS